MKHVEECFLAKPCRHNDGVHVPQEYVAGFPVTICGLCMNDCICKELLSAGARGYKSGYDDAYFDGYNDGYDSALSHRACFNQHGTGENP